MSDESTNESGSENKETEGNKETKKPKTESFTQADVDRIVRERLAREKEKYQDFDTLKSKAAKLDELEAANQTEIEKLTAERDKWKAEAESNGNRANTFAQRAAVVAEASRQKAMNPDDVFALIGKDALKVNDDGSVEGVAEAVTTLLKDRPHWVGTRQTQMGDADGGTRTGAGSASGTFTRSQLRDPAFFQQNRDAILAAQKAGQILDE